MTKYDKRWIKEMERWGRWKDNPGCSLDPGILEAVVAINLLGFPTEMSCQGHLDHDYPAPWIRLSLPYQEKGEIVTIQWKKLGRLIERLHWVFTDFSSGDYEDALIIFPNGLLTTPGLVRQYTLPLKKRKAHLNFYRLQFQLFAHTVGRLYLHVDYDTLMETIPSQEDIQKCDKAYVRGSTTNALR